MDALTINRHYGKPCQKWRTTFQFTETDEKVAYAMCDRLQALLAETALHAYEIWVGPVNQYALRLLGGNRWYATVQYCDWDKDTVQKAWEIASTRRDVIDMPHHLRVHNV